jgi:hypothetical protein
MINSNCPTSKVASLKQGLCLLRFRHHQVKGKNRSLKHSRVDLKHKETYERYID